MRRNQRATRGKVEQGATTLFAYGTLRRGAPMHGLLEGRTDWIGFASVAGSLVDLGAFRDEAEHDPPRLGRVAGALDREAVALEGRGRSGDRHLVGGRGEPVVRGRGDPVGQLDRRECVHRRPSLRAFPPVYLLLQAL